MPISSIELFYNLSISAKIGQNPANTDGEELNNFYQKNCP